MLELIFVRHGETDSNKRSTYLGWTDIELNEAGIRQALCARGKLEGFKVDAIMSSPLKRAAKTAEVINEGFNLEIQYDQSLKERNFGKWDDLTYNEISERYPEERRTWEKDWLNYRIEGGESAIEAYERITGFIDGLVKQNDKGTFVIVTHLGCIRMMVAFLLGMGLEGSWRFRIDNCGITRIEVNEEKYSYLTLLNG